MQPILNQISKIKYELLLIAILQHLYIGIFIEDLNFYTKIIWPINMLIVGVSSVGIFIEKGRLKNQLQLLLFLVIIALPIGLAFNDNNHYYFLLLNITYVIYFIWLLYEILIYLVKPSYINTDIISAAACGYLLLIETCTFTMQYFVYKNEQSFNGINLANPASTYMDLVYFSSITLTSIGFGDITPNTHHTKLLTSLFGITG